MNLFKLFRKTELPPQETENLPPLNVIYDQQTFSVMKKVISEKSNCVDVGCHVGEILKKMLDFSPRGQHYAFEPIPELCQGLQEQFGVLPNVSVSCAALSDKVGSSEFQHVVSNPGYSGLKKRRYDRDNEVIGKISVQTDTLDNFLPPGTPIDFIKVDIEGGEVGFFRGALQTIKNNRPYIVFEHGAGGADYYGDGPADVYEILVEQCGLKLTLMENWLAKKPPFSRQDLLDQFYNGTNYYFLAYP
ncbi:FkbM family methyltransferase [Candidatus Thiosymbion oneisti]|uniref:FkbM family methyltransferase n=1 Tax=Candidatus Thiosymbion oneisti TaxID=589554 RepID=UPI00159F1793|nr:FkbM family methyltransferase [Candidatus Thiosymbion oneisti]